jgi:hypothetical protein
MQTAREIAQQFIYEQCPQLQGNIALFTQLVAYAGTHSPAAPAVRDADVEELVRMAESAEMWLQNSIPVGGMPMLRAAIARVKGTKEEPHD